MARTKTIYINSADIRKFISDLSEQKKTFQVSTTAYTQKIALGELNYFFTNELATVWLFLAHKKIKADLKKSNIVFDVKPRNLIKYYQINNLFRDLQPETYLGDVYNIDIKSAYPTTMRKLGFISEETFNFLHEIPDGFTDHQIQRRKIERLKSIGMIATEKNIFYFNEGNYNRWEVKQDEYGKNVFNLICFEVGEVMRDIAGAYQDNFLFFWVDGIYLKKTDTEKAEELLSDYGYKFKKEMLSDFLIKKSDTFVELSFFKDKEKKVFMIPILSDELRQNTEAMKQFKN